MLFVLPDVWFSPTTRAAIDEIGKLPMPDRAKKRLLGEWFQNQPPGSYDDAARRAAYDLLLGREANIKLRG